MNHILIENKYGHGAKPKPFDPRDHRAEKLGAASEPFDWSVGFDVETKLNAPLPVEDQGQSFSCGGQSLRYAFEALNQLDTGTFERLSAKDPYSLIFYPGGGTDVRSLGKIAVQRGVASEAVVPSYMNGAAPTEAFMQDNSVSKTLSLNLVKELGFAFANLDIDSVAQAARDNQVCILQVNGFNNGSWTSPYPQPAPSYNWSHFLVCLGAKLINGVKHIKVKNSWGSSVGDNGVQWLPETYFDGQGVVECMVFYDKAQSQYTPSVGQTILSWAWGLVQWVKNYKLPYGG